MTPASDNSEYPNFRESVSAIDTPSSHSERREEVNRGSDGGTW